MTTESHFIRVGDFDVEVVRKRIKNIHLATYPPDGRVRIAVPEHIDDGAVRMAVVEKAGWIRRQQAAFTKQERYSPREYVDGESHWVWGQRYRLRVVETHGRHTAKVRGRRLELHVRAGATRDQREAALTRWYREELSQALPPLLEKWETVVGASASDWGIKRMRTKWGSCNPTARRLWFNLDLATKPPQCLEYVVVHELVHLIDSSHGEGFMALMDRALPTWRGTRDLLNAAPLVDISAAA